MHDHMYDDALRAFRTTVRRFVAAHVTPYHKAWEQAGAVPHALYATAGEAGLLCPGLREENGGGGLPFRYGAVVAEELARAHATGVAFALHSEIVAPYIESYGTVAQQRAWLPAMASGGLVGAIAMSEPGAGSDLQGLTTRAVFDGDTWVINGTKTFVSNGQLADLVIVVCRTEDASAGHSAQSLIVVPSSAPGFVRGKALDKIGMHAQDTSELHFEDCRVPAANLLGERGQGFVYLMQKLATERLIIAVCNVAAARDTLDQTVAYVKERHAFGKPIAAFQNTRFRIAEMATEVELGETFVERCIARIEAGDELSVEASMAKAWCSEMLGRVVDGCVQLFGGAGYMSDMPVARAYLDARVQRIYGGTTEIMKEIIARRVLA